MSAMREVPLFVVERRARNPRPKVPRYRVSLVKEAGSVYVTSRPVTSAETIFKMSKQLFEDADREMFYVVGLDAKRKIIGVNLVTVGVLLGSLVHPREVFKPLILMNANTFIAVHNHPSSGDPMPSNLDRSLTDRLVEAGRYLGIQMTDHVICTDDGYFSFSEHNLIPD